MPGLTVQSTGWPILQEAMPRTMIVDQLQHKPGVTLEDLPEHLKRWHYAVKPKPVIELVVCLQARKSVKVVGCMISKLEYVENNLGRAVCLLADLDVVNVYRNWTSSDAGGLQYYLNLL